METIASSNPNGASVSYSYDELNRLSTVTDERLLGNQTTTYTCAPGVPVDRSWSTGWEPASNVATATYPNGLQSTFTYDTLNRLTAMNAGTASYGYQLGATGNRLSSTENNGRALNWSFDGIHRLTNEQITNDPQQNDGSVSYSLDPVGNRLSLNSTLPGINSGSFGSTADDEVTSETYDANGNTSSTDGKNYTYDSENHMTLDVRPEQASFENVHPENS